MDSTIKILTNLLRLLENWKSESLELLKDEPGAGTLILQEYSNIKSGISLQINNRRLMLLRAQSLKLKAESLPSGPCLINQKDLPALSVCEAMEAISQILNRLEGHEVSKRPVDQNKDEMLRKSAILGGDPLK